MKWLGSFALVLVMMITVLTAGAAVRFRQEPGVSVWGLSTDTKPFVTQRGDTLSAGTIFTETDTGKKWLFNGSTWSVLAVSVATDTTRLTSPGYTAAVSVKGYREAAWYFTISDINTSLTTCLEAKKGNGSWTPVIVASTTYTANGSYGLFWTSAVLADSLRGRFIAEVGGTDSELLSNFALGGE